MLKLLFFSSSVGTPPQSPTLQAGRKAFSNSSTPPKQATISEDIVTSSAPPVMDPKGPEARSPSTTASSGTGNDWSTSAATNLPQSGQVKERRSISSTRTVVGTSAGSVSSGLPPGKPASRYYKLYILRRFLLLKFVLRMSKETLKSYIPFIAEIYSKRVDQFLCIRVFCEN